MKSLLSALCFSLCLLVTPNTFAKDPIPQHGLSMYGDLKYPAGFTHFEYVNPNAPKGGDVKLAESGRFDTVHPFILKGVKAPGILISYESLMAYALDEPKSMYGLVAHSVVVAPDHSYVEFFMRPEARWHDGTAITADDVVFSFNTLKTKGDPIYKLLYTPISSCEKTGAYSVRFTFEDTQNKELPTLAAGMPLLSKTYWSKHDFEKTTLTPPLASGPYKISNVDPGRSIIFKRVKDYWGKDLPVNKGQYNFDSLRFDMYRDENVSLEALKAGAYDFRREYISRNWATGYTSPAIDDGRLIKKNIPDQTPQGMQAFLFNTRKDKFSDRRVREAISRSMDFEWINKTIFYNAYVRNESFFTNTDYQSKGLPSKEELALLSPHAEALPQSVFTHAFKNPVNDGSGNARKSLLKAQALLDEAGWTIKNGKRVNAHGEPLTIEFMLRQPTMERVIGPMRKNLERLGITASIRMVDDSQYQKRIDTHDFDIISLWINRALHFPGSEQMALWHSSQAQVKGSNNHGGIRNPVIDMLTEKIANAKDAHTLKIAARALDRVLLHEHYVIPHWHSDSYRVAYWNKFAMPEIKPKYDMGFYSWWIKE